MPVGHGLDVSLARPFQDRLFVVLTFAQNERYSSSTQARFAVLAIVVGREGAGCRTYLVIDESTRAAAIALSLLRPAF